ncbi:PfkB family carbohydrate kinase [Paramicrobacterium agarici]|uniref:PfkB family carbohydrate kinase n=1 Tax=Paramicrobacterium agarici TaxID=630514 RepID=UPI001168ED77|nr:PfkB family carbohydrate kinase [Microbacterium agarici]TQO22884.1 sugar/nucleoside kinase (ribokinase family) [Microbacterium agarici]
MSEQGRLVYVGNVIVDLVMQINAIPEPGGDTLARSSMLTAGGGFNTMVAAARDGADVVFTGQYGTGPFGSTVRAALADNDFDVVQPGIENVDSGYCVALVDATTERTFVTSVGAEGMLTADDLARVSVSENDIVFVSGYSLAHPSNATAIPGWLESLPGHVRVVLDPSPLIGDLDPNVRERVLRRTDILTLNAREARILSGGHEQSDAAERLTSVIRAGGSVIVRDAERGAYLAQSGKAVETIPAVTVTALDSNGAGDAHGGVFAAALLRGAGMPDAVRRANVAAALSVTKAGPSTSPTSTEIDAALAGDRE